MRNTDRSYRPFDPYPQMPQNWLTLNYTHQVPKSFFQKMSQNRSHCGSSTHSKPSARTAQHALFHPNHYFSSIRAYYHLVQIPFFTILSNIFLKPTQSVLSSRSCLSINSFLRFLKGKRRRNVSLGCKESNPSV